MNIRRKIADFAAAIAGQFGFVKMPSGIAGGGGGLMGFSSLGSARKQAESYQYHVYKCVTLIYRRAQSIGFKLFKERASGDDDEVNRHPFLELMYRPNPLMTGSDLKALTFMHRDLTGRAFWLLNFNRLGRPAEIWPLPAANFSRLVFSRDESELTGFEFLTASGGPKIYSPEEIVYFRYPHPGHLLDGASPIQAMAFAYDTDLAIRVYQRNFFQNSARADVVLQTEQTIQPEDARRILMSWKENHQGVAKAFEPAMLDKGLKAEILSVSAKDFEFAALARWTKQDILEAYNIPEGKLGTVTDVNRANGLALDITFNSECIKPRLDSFDEQVTHSLLPYYDSGLYFLHDECVPRDRELELKERESNLKGKLTTVNEERAKDGLEPVAWGNAPWISIAEMQYGDEPAIVRGAEKNPPQPPFAKGGDKGPGEITKAARGNQRRLHERKVAGRSRVYRKWLRRFFAAQRVEVKEKLDQYYERINGAIAGMSGKKASAWLAQHKNQLDRINIDIHVANRELVEGSGPYLEGAILSAGEEALALVESAIDLEIFSPQALGYLKTHRILLQDVNAVTLDKISASLAEGFEAGETMVQMAQRLDAIFDEADSVRSLRIAQTEINSAANFGSLEGYRQSGVVEKKEWLAGGDARHTHIVAGETYKGGGAIPISQDFYVGTGHGPCPGSIGVAAEDINCRCTILPVIAKE